MDALEEDDEEKYKRQFAKYLEDDVSSESLEDIYREAHEKIRADPSFTPTQKQANYDETKNHKDHKLSKDAKKARVNAKLRRIQDERMAQ